MNLDTFPFWVWLKLANYALSIRDRRAVSHKLAEYFYAHIYETWSRGKVAYEGNLPAGGTDVKGWKKLVKLWQNTFKAKKTGEALKDHGVGRFELQADGKDESECYEMARLWEHYNSRPLVSRFQFVASTGGGMVLFNRMRRACQQCILDKGGGTPDEWARGFCIRGWKVFGEEGANGRSDSCVVYLAERADAAAVLEVVDRYIWPAIRDLVEADFVPLGFFRVGGKPLWTMPIPSKDREIAVLGKSAQGSAGGLMGLVLGKSYSDALSQLQKRDAPLLAEAAMTRAGSIVGELFKSSPALIRRPITN